MKKIIRLTETDLTRIVKRVIMQEQNPMPAKIGNKIITVTPKITIDCTKKVISHSDLPKLGDRTMEIKKNESIIYQYCK